MCHRGYNLWRRPSYVLCQWKGEVTEASKRGFLDRSAQMNTHPPLPHSRCGELGSQKLHWKSLSSSWYSARCTLRCWRFWERYSVTLALNLWVLASILDAKMYWKFELKHTLWTLSNGWDEEQELNNSLKRKWKEFWLNKDALFDLSCGEYLLLIYQGWSSWEKLYLWPLFYRRDPTQ